MKTVTLMAVASKIFCIQLLLVCQPAYAGEGQSVVELSNKLGVTTRVVVDSKKPVDLLDSPGHMDKQSLPERIVDSLDKRGFVLKSRNSCRS